MKVKNLIVMLLIVSVASACAPASPTTAPGNNVSSPVQTAAAQTAMPGATNTPTATLSKVEEPTAIKTQQVVVTATGMTDLGPLLNTVPDKNETNPIIDWDQHFKSEKWEEKPCLYDEKVICYYAQTSVEGSFSLSDFGQVPLTVPNAWHLIAGTYEGSMELENGFSKNHTNGFLFALSSNTVVKSLSLKDGFMKLVPSNIAREEFCAALQQAVDHEWAHDWNYGDDAWGTDPCKGLEIVVPLDSDRIP
jgi:hypothetical protein